MAGTDGETTLTPEDITFRLLRKRSFNEVRAFVSEHIWVNGKIDHMNCEEYVNQYGWTWEEYIDEAWRRYSSSRYDTGA